MLLKALLYISLAIVIYGLTHHYGVQFTYADFKAYLDILINISGMVFTLMGIWIAVLYPNALSRLIQPTKISTPDFSESLRETKRLEAIVLGVLQSGLVVVAGLAIAVLKLTCGSTEFYTSNSTEIKLCALSFVVTLSIIQSEAIFQVLKANVFFLLDLHQWREQREIDNDV